MYRTVLNDELCWKNPYKMYDMYILTWKTLTVFVCLLFLLIQYDLNEQLDKQFELYKDKLKVGRVFSSKCISMNIVLLKESDISRFLSVIIIHLEGMLHSMVP